MTPPMGFVISHLKTMMEMKTRRSMMKSIPMEQPMPTLFTCKRRLWQSLYVVTHEKTKMIAINEKVSL